MDQELRYSDNSFFVTFTYDDDSLIFADVEPCLYKRHLQLYFKQLRKQLEKRSIKYYAVGEYGDLFNRPHYHALIFYRGMLDWFRLKMIIKDTWKYGICQVLPVSGAQGYVTKYILKFDHREHLVKPFSLISHGLGIDYLSDKMVSYHRSNLTSYATKPGGYRISLPRYYKDKIFSEYERLLLKQRADIYRKSKDLEKLARFDLQLDFGVNPFEAQIIRYQQRLYNSMKLYKQKKKL